MIVVVVVCVCMYVCVCQHNTIIIIILLSCIHYTVYIHDTRTIAPVSTTDI
jgi:hypothetical protein